MKKKFFIIVLVVLIALFFIQDNNISIIRNAGYKTLKTMAYYNNVKFNKDIDFYESRHFIIGGSDIDSNVGAKIGILLDKAYYLVGKEFDYFPDKKSPVILYKDMGEFWEQNKQLEGQDIMGLYHMGIIHLIVPEVFGMDFSQYEREGPVLHEYTHKLVDDISLGNVDIWFTEGLALYQEYLHYGTKWGEGLDYSDNYTIEELKEDFFSLDNVQAYKQAFDMVSKIYNKKEKEELIKILNQLGKGKNIEELMSFEQIF